MVYWIYKSLTAVARMEHLSTRSPLPTYPQTFDDPDFITCCANGPVGKACAALQISGCSDAAARLSWRAIEAKTSSRRSLPANSCLQKHCRSALTWAPNSRLLFLTANCARHLLSDATSHDIFNWSVISILTNFNDLESFIIGTSASFGTWLHNSSLYLHSTLCRS